MSYVSSHQETIRTYLASPDRQTHIVAFKLPFLDKYSFYVEKLNETNHTWSCTDVSNELFDTYGEAIETAVALLSSKIHRTLVGYLDITECSASGTKRDSKITKLTLNIENKHGINMNIDDLEQMLPALPQTLGHQRITIT